MAFDSNLVLQASTTQTASFNSAGVSMRQPSATSLTNAGGTPRRGLAARIGYSAASNASGSNSVVFSIQHSDDNSTWTTIAQQLEAALALSTTAQAGVFTIPFSTDKPWVRLVMTLSGGGSTPTVTYYGDVSTAWARPA